MIDIISQTAISVLGVAAIILVGNKNRWGFVAGLLSQPFWFMTTYMHEQWGLFALSVIYTGTWMFGIYEWFWKKSPASTAGEVKV